MNLYSSREKNVIENIGERSYHYQKFKRIAVADDIAEIIRFTDRGLITCAVANTCAVKIVLCCS